MERIHIVKKSVTKLDVDCVVNAANEGLWAGGGVCGAIFKEAGYNELTDAWWSMLMIVRHEGGNL